MKLIISIELKTDDNDQGISGAKKMLETIKDLLVTQEATVSLVRDGDRSAKNLLLPKVEGRFGNHYQSGKAKIEDILNKT